MNFRIAETFASSLAKLTAQEQKTVKTTVFDLQLNPAHPGLKFHRLERAKDPNFWSIRASGDLRVIVHKTQADILVCYVDHHDKAYAWGERRRVAEHPKTGVTQIVEIRERVEEVPIYKQVIVEEKGKSSAPEEPPLSGRTEDELLSYGVPEDWVADVLAAADEDALLELSDRLPAEAAEAVLDLADGKTPEVPAAAPEGEGFDHPDALRRFRLFTDEDELALALDYPWEKWTIFLHPSQRRFVDKQYGGPARIGGSAGTGKTVVALHRAVALARRYPGKKVLLTTFSPALADLLRIKLQRLIGEATDTHAQITVQALPDVCADLYARQSGKFLLANDEEVRGIIEGVIADRSPAFSTAFFWSEWRHIVDAWQVASLEEYLEVPRVGRRTRLGANQREAMWEICEAVRSRLQADGRVTWATAFGRVRQDLSESGERPWDFVIVDEAQDLGVAELRFLALLGDREEEGLFFAGDGGQRIFQLPFSWKSLGVDVRGRSERLRVNYRTSHQIRKQADILLPDEISDADGNTTDRTGTVSIFNGLPPEIAVHADLDAEVAEISAHLLRLQKEGLQPEEIGVFVRGDGLMPRARAVLKSAGIGWSELERTSIPPAGMVALATMHLAKGLEFRAVVVMACDHDQIPLAERVASVADEAELEEVFNTERHLLYVAATRAREHLYFGGVAPISEFVRDIEASA